MTQRCQMMQVFFLLPWMLSGFNQRLQRCQLQKSSLYFVVKTCKNNFLEFTICRYLSYVLPSQPANLQNSPAPARVCRATETLAYKHCTCTAKTSKDRSLKRSFEAPKAPFAAFRLAFDRPKRLWKSVSAVASRLALFAIKVGGEGALKLHRVHVWDVLSRSFMRFTDTDFPWPSQPTTTTITSANMY